MRTLKELYQVLLDNYDNECIFWGVCTNIVALRNKNLITDSEFDTLYPDFKTRVITWKSKFYWNPSYNLRFKNWNPFWWKQNKKGLVQRKLYIKHIISKL